MKKNTEIKNVDANSSSATPTWEIDPMDGTHRIRAGQNTGQWSAYQQIATLKVGTTVYYAASDYYYGSLPTCAVFTVKLSK